MTFVLPEVNAMMVQPDELPEVWGVSTVTNLAELAGTLDVVVALTNGRVVGKRYFDYLRDPYEGSRFILASDEEFYYHHLYRLWGDGELLTALALLVATADSLILDDAFAPVVDWVSANKEGYHTLTLDHVALPTFAADISAYVPSATAGWLKARATDAVILDVNTVTCRLYDTLVCFIWPDFPDTAYYETSLHLVYSDGYELHIYGEVETPYRIDQIVPDRGQASLLTSLSFYCRLPGSMWSTVSIAYSQRSSSPLLSPVLREVHPH